MHLVVGPGDEEDGVELRLDAEEVDALRDLLMYQLGDLRMQIADTDTSSFREQLRAEKRMVVRLLDKLGEDVGALA
jgi:hypothetical protein